MFACGGYAFPAIHAELCLHGVVRHLLSGHRQRTLRSCLLLPLL